mmetsp:Transcript_5977/g.9677  ORF Transcript_5977/g.9677 Transcript_5977/m.9677 type:complete len:107 (-) Transcript_5977:1077-1397(-)
MKNYLYGMLWCININIVATLYIHIITIYSVLYILCRGASTPLPVSHLIVEDKSLSPISSPDCFGGYNSTKGSSIKTFIIHSRRCGGFTQDIKACLQFPQLVAQNPV